ncbi:MAG: hypothetical protein M3Y35_02630 [Actinomycetota bacterium]|nr:hypothetical protein [Actinomycetota bacterium]
MNRHVRIFWGIFFWIAVAICAFFAIVNSTATPSDGTAAMVFAAVGVVCLIGGVLLVRDRQRV